MSDINGIGKNELLNALRADQVAINKKVDDARTEMLAKIAAKIDVAVMKVVSDGGKPEIVWREGRCYVVDLSLLPPLRRNI